MAEPDLSRLAPYILRSEVPLNGENAELVRNAAMPRKNALGIRRGVIQNQ